MKRVLPLVLGVAVAAIVFVALPAGDDPEPTRARGTPPQGRALFAAMGCGTCHTLAAAGSRGDMAPSLDERLPNHTKESLRAVIVSPPANSIMPPNFGERMNARQLDALVNFLLASAKR